MTEEAASPCPSVLISLTAFPWMYLTMEIHALGPGVDCIQREFTYEVKK